MVEFGRKPQSHSLIIPQRYVTRRSYRRFDNFGSVNRAANYKSKFWGYFRVRETKVLFSYRLFSEEQVSHLKAFDGRWGGVQGDQSLPLPVLLCPFVSRIPPVFRLVKRIRNPGLTFKLCQNLTSLFVSWPLFVGSRLKLLQVSFLN